MLKEVHVQQMSIEEAWHSLDVTEVLSRLNTSTRGLSSEEAASRLKRYGYNEIVAVRKVSPVTIFLSQFKNVLIMILLCATVLSLVMGHEVDAIVIFAIVIVSALVGFTQEYKAERAIEALKRMLSPKATVIRDGDETEVLAREVVPGDILVLKEGDKIPADARLIEVVNLQVNEAPLTGESVPTMKDVRKVPKDAFILERKNMVFSGTDVTYGKGKAVVVATGMNTEFGKIAKHVTALVEEETPLERRTRELGKWLGAIALTISALVIVLGVIRGLPILEMVLFGVALAVAAVPEALPAVVTGSLAIGMYRMAKRNALVRRMPAVETLGCTSVICSDKTGTLTKGEMTVRRIYVCSKIVNVSGVGYEPKGELHVDVGHEAVLKSEPFSLLMKGAVLCNDAKLVLEGDRWRIKGDPTEGALIVAAEKAGFKRDEVVERFPRVGELPFSSERKRMTTVHLEADGHQIVYMKGAPEVVLSKCSYVHELGGVEVLSEGRRAEVLRVNEEMASDALRVLGIAYKRLPAGTKDFGEDAIEGDLIFLGLMGMIDPPREEAIEAVKVCKRVGIKPIMITGDHKLTALAIAKEMGIYEDGDIVLTGEELERMNDEEFEEIVGKVTVYARVSPLNKLRIVKAWKKKGQVVAMTGDGVNDAPALKHADIGAAMGITGTEVTKEAADLVLADDNFATIVGAVELGRWIYDNIKRYLTYLLRANLMEVVVLSIAVLAGLPLPLLPVQILYVNLATDGLPAIALGISPPDPDIMERPPRHPKETVFTRDVKTFILCVLLIGCPLLLWLFLSSLPLGEGVARTRLFLMFVFFELALALNCRSLKYTLLEAKPHKFLLLAVLWEIALILTLINVPVTQQALGIVPIGVLEGVFITSVCLTVLIVVEVTKRLLRTWIFSSTQALGL